MPKYKIIHTLLQTPTRNFMQDEIVTPRELAEAGTDLDFLLHHGTIAPLEGTEDMQEAFNLEAGNALLDENDALRIRIADLEARLAGGVNTNPSDVAPNPSALSVPEIKSEGNATPTAAKKNDNGAETGLTQNPQPPQN